MPAAAGAISKIVAKGWPLVRANWPRIVAALGIATKFLHDNPAIPERLRKTLADVPRRIVDAQQRRGDAARIRGALEIIRDVVHDATHVGQVDLDAAAYLGKAHGIEQAVRLAEQQGKPEKKATLARLKAQTDALLAELIAAVADTGTPSPESREDEPHPGA